MHSYTKKVSHRELQFYLIACETGLTPKIIKIETYDTYSELITECYSHTLYEVMKTDQQRSLEILDQARKLVARLHAIGILHGDLSEENIVWDSDSNTVALIDFGMALRFTDLSEVEIQNKIEDLYEGIKYSDATLKGVDLLLSTELSILTFLEECIRAKYFT